MTSNPVRARTIAMAKAVGLAALLIAAMWWRRPDQFLHPYVWVEDGTLNLPDFVANGWGFVVQPIVGYISLPIRILFGIAVSLSFRWLPEIGFVLTLLFTYAVLAAVAFSPTALRHKFLCAVAVLLIPINSEVYGVSLYAGWWGSLLAILPLLWPLAAAGQVWLRTLLLIVAGLSTPITIGLLPLYGLRWYLSRRRAEGWLFILCGALALLQATVAWRNAAALGASAIRATWLNLPGKFFGQYVYWTALDPYSPNYFWVGLAFIAFLVASAYVRRRTLDWPFAGLIGCLVIVIALSVVRAPAEVMHPIVAGGRYFFLPFVLMSWLLLYLLDIRHLVTTVVCVGVLLLSVRTMVNYSRWTHPPIDWRAHIDQCIASSSHSFPIQYEGNAAHHIIWSVELSGEACQKLVTGSLFDNRLRERSLAR